MTAAEKKFDWPLCYEAENLLLGRIDAFLAEREADQAAAMAGHEVDRFGRHLLGGDRQVAFILAILVVHQDDHLALTEVFENFLDCVQFHVSTF